MKITIAGESFEYDPTTLTLDEAEAIEDYTGFTITEFGERLGAGSVKALKGMMFVAKRRADPATKYADIGAWNMGDIEIDAGEEGPDPLDPGHETVPPEG